jgi:hypothetical protein
LLLLSYLLLFEIEVRQVDGCLSAIGWMADGIRHQTLTLDAVLALDFGLENGWVEEIAIVVGVGRWMAKEKKNGWSMMLVVRVLVGSWMGVASFISVYV